MERSTCSTCTHFENSQCHETLRCLDPRGMMDATSWGYPPVQATLPACGRYVPKLPGPTHNRALSAPPETKDHANRADGKKRMGK